MSFGNSGDFDRDNRTGPYASSSQTSPPAKSNTLWWILGILGVLFGGAALVCCGGSFYLYRFGTQVVGDVVKQAVAADPAIQEHIGTINEVTMNLGATSNAGGGGKVVFDITGDKGSGLLEVVMDNSPQGQSVKSCVLILPTGERHDIVVNMDDPAAIDDESIDIGEPVPITAPETPQENPAEVEPVPN